MSNPHFPDPVTLSVDGASESIRLVEGRWDFEMYATTWDATETAAIEFAGEDVEARYGAITDPATGEAMARKANGTHIIFESGGGYVRLNAPTIGDTEGLTLVAKYIGP